MVKNVDVTWAYLLKTGRTINIPHTTTYHEFPYILPIDITHTREKNIPYRGIGEISW